jgi:hypothetical protein
VAQRTPSQLVLRRRVESLIGLVAPALDLLLFAGDRASRIAGRNEVDPEPARLGRRRDRTPIGGPPSMPEQRG